MSDPIKVREYTQRDRAEVLKLLIRLHGDYKQKVYPEELFELTRDRDIKTSFRSYLEEIHRDRTERWKILVAECGNSRLIGFIIGSIEADPYIELDQIGVVEDWFVKPEYRGHGIGKRLYQVLEEWFRERGCRQARSTTWIRNILGQQAHENLGFLRYGIVYRKRL